MGNALVDVLMRIDDGALLESMQLPKGSMQLINESRFADIEQKSADLNKSTVTGGSAANTACALACLGVDTAFIGKVGKDGIGDFFINDMQSNGVSPKMAVCRKPSGRCNIFITPDGERTMATHLGAAALLSPLEIEKEMFEGYDILHIEGYLVQNYNTISRAAILAKKAGLKVSFDLASYNIVEENIEFLTDFVNRYVDIVFANEEEASAYTSLPASEAVHRIAEQCEVAVVKMGARGSSVKSGDEYVHVPALNTNPVDTTGAGDIYAAGFLMGYASGMPLRRCAEIGTLCAAEVIGVVGGKIDSAAWQKIKTEIL